MRFYKKIIKIENGQTKHYIGIDSPGSAPVEIEISSELNTVLDEMQREHWKLEKREQRHCVHLDAIPEYRVPMPTIQNPLFRMEKAAHVRIGSY